MLDLQSAQHVAAIVGIVRDTLLIVLFLVSLGILIAVYAKLSAVLESIRRTVASADKIMETVSENIVEPAVAGSGVAFGLSKIAAFVSGRRSNKAKGGETHGE